MTASEMMEMVKIMMLKVRSLVSRQSIMYLIQIVEWKMQYFLYLTMIQI